jgi:hypothetical protein
MNQGAMLGEMLYYRLACRSSPAPEGTAKSLIAVRDGVNAVQSVSRYPGLSQIVEGLITHAPTFEERFLFQDMAV